MKKPGNLTKKIYIRLILPYTCVLIIPIFIWWISNLYIIHNNEQNMMMFLENGLKNSINMVDSNLSQAEDIVNRMSQNETIQKFYEKKKPTHVETSNIQKVLASYFIENRQLGKLYIYSEASGHIIDTNNIYPKKQDFIISCFPENAQSKEERIEDFNNRMWLNGYGSQIKMFEETSSKLWLPYVRTIPISNPSQKQGNITVMINVDNLLSCFNNLFGKGDVEVYVFSNDGDLVIGKGDRCFSTALASDDSSGYEKLNVDDSEFYQFSMKSPQRKWRYHIFVDGKSVLQELKTINCILTTVMLLAILLGCCLCIYFAYERKKSYLWIMRSFGIDENALKPLNLKTNEFELWKPYIRNLLAENEKIRKDIERLNKDGDYKVLHLLLAGSLENENVAKKLLENSMLSLPKKYFIVLTLRSSSINNVADNNNENLLLTNLLKEFSEEKFHIYIADAKTTVLLINFDEPAEEFYNRLKMHLINLNLEVQYYYKIETTMGIGVETDKLCDIGKSYQQSQEVIAYNQMLESGDLLFYNELPRYMEMYYYPIDIENSLIASISLGNEDKAVKILKTIYEENFEKRRLSLMRIRELISEIYSSLNKVRQVYLKDEEHLTPDLNSFTVRSFFEFAKNFVCATCVGMRKFEQTAQNARFKQILDYIQENYMNNQLSRDSIADKFEISDSTYISKMFKKFMNENFYSYLERIRIDKACELLSRNIPVKDVAEQVGYLSDISFRRAFKKRLGVSPSEYKS